MSWIDGYTTVNMFVGHFDLEELEMGDPQTSNNTPYRVTCRSADLSFPFDRPIVCKRVKLYWPIEQ